MSASINSKYVTRDPQLLSLFNDLGFVHKELSSNSNTNFSMSAHESQVVVASKREALMTSTQNLMNETQLNIAKNRCDVIRIIFQELICFTQSLIEQTSGKIEIKHKEIQRAESENVSLTNQIRAAYDKQRSLHASLAQLSRREADIIQECNNINGDVAHIEHRLRKREREKIGGFLLGGVAGGLSVMAIQELEGSKRRLEQRRQQKQGELNQLNIERSSTERELKMQGELIYEQQREIELIEVRKSNLEITIKNLGKGLTDLKNTFKDLKITKSKYSFLSDDVDIIKMLIEPPIHKGPIITPGSILYSMITDFVNDLNNECDQLERCISKIG